MRKRSKKDLCPRLKLKVKYITACAACFRVWVISISILWPILTKYPRGAVSFLIKKKKIIELFQKALQGIIVFELLNLIRKIELSLI